ncbi:MAG: glycoside hydrolase family 95 protein [Bacteroidales bacterium]|nr:glycoside hydrolase family 95 protein [Candidatus Liminaster caballi]
MMKHTLILGLMAMPLLAIGQNENLVLRYDRPATFFEESLVIGNGTLGAAVYGGVDEDKISLNDLTLWTGEPSADNVYSPEAWRHLDHVRQLLDNEDYAHVDEAYKAVEGEYSQNYQPLGTLSFTAFGNTASGMADYHRSLSLSDATARVVFGNYERQYFASAPDSVIVIHIKAKNGASINEKIGFHSLLPYRSQSYLLDGGKKSKNWERTIAQGDKSHTSADMVIDGYTAYASSPNYTGTIDWKDNSTRGIHFRTIVRAIALDGGSVRNTYSDMLEVRDCKELLVLVSNVTSYNGRYNDPVKAGRDYKNDVQARIDAASQKTVAQLHAAHKADFAQYFNRLTIDLGQTAADIAAKPTDVQLREYGELNQSNPDLEELYFQFGRYLLISCSRTHGVPANLQGLWNEQILPPWSCNYTSNINLEENYWPAEVANLSEMHQPMLDFVKSLPRSGEITARHYYNVQKGWCLGHNTDIWGLTNPVGRSEGDPSWAAWNMGGAWVATHLWEHYTFTLDKAFLSSAYPVLKGAADFCLGWMIEKNGYLMTSPCTSPENRYLIPETGVTGATFYGGFADIAMIRECLLDTRAAAVELGIDKAYCDTIDATLKRLLPYRIGKRGNLQEFYHDWEGEDPEHRHQSHLFGLYPGHHITVANTPKLAKACAKTLEIKGPKSTGWSTGWRVNLQARLHDADKAYGIYRMLLTYIAPEGKGGGTYPNLLDSHQPFQIDGNFGGCAGVMEMLVQSSFESGKPAVVELLPAVPAVWKEAGHISGICVRGGYVLDFAWKNGKITSLKVTSRRSDTGSLKITCGSRKWSANVAAGETKTIL